MSEPFRIDRRTTIKWVVAAAAALPALRRSAVADAEASTAAEAMPARGYGSDPDLMRIYQPGDLWPLTFTDGQRRSAAALCDLIVPEDAVSPGASALGVVDFIDEWISALYLPQQEDRRSILAGLEWLDAESIRRFGRGFADLEGAEMTAIGDEISYLPRARPEFATAASFFAKFRDLTLGGFYTTPEGMRDIQYLGNVALARFDGPPPEVLRRVGLGEDPA
ncbi:MAG: gluconate 2-dehydrogenase subunit 3 family protein [Steroidobacteraceae bacterium]